MATNSHPTADDCWNVGYRRHGDTIYVPFDVDDDRLESVVTALAESSNVRATSIMPRPDAPGAVLMVVPRTSLVVPAVLHQIEGELIRCWGCDVSLTEDEAVQAA